jgi:hypothetical protein
MPNEDSTTDNAELAEKLKNARGHSPAPWRGTSQGDIFDANDVIVATIYDNPDTGLQPLEEETSDFNQALITTAPDLLAAAEAVEFHCPQGELKPDERYPVSLIGAQITMLRDAITQARGGEAI